MSYILNNEITFADSPALDAFGRLRVSNPYNLFHSDLTITSGQTEYETVLSGGGSAYWNLQKSEVQFYVTTNGDKVIREQHGYNFYQPGKSQLVEMTGVFGTPVANVTKRMGYYNDNNGLRFELSGTTFGVVLRTNTSGSVVDEFIPQSQWNLDTLITGSTLNPSGKHLNVTKTNIYATYFQWLGVGRVIFAVVIDGILIPVHQILNANNKDVVYMRSGSRPVRYEVISNGGSDSTFKQICATVISEGGQEQVGYERTVSNGLTTKTINSRQSLLSIRLNNTMNDITNRIKCSPIAVELMTTTSSVNAYWELVLQRSHLGENNLGGSPTWTPVGTDGGVLEYSINGTTVAGGVVLSSGYVYTTTQQGDKTTSLPIKTDDIMALNYSGTTSDWLHLVVTPSVTSAWASAVALKIDI